MILTRYFVIISPLLSSVFACIIDSDCSLNGVCNDRTCNCYAGWTASDCGALDLQPIPYTPSGYNLTAEHTSSWGGKIIQDPKIDNLFHLFVAEFIDRCGLDYWTPYSRIVRAESITGILGPYIFVAEVVGTFAHNPSVVWSPKDNLYLLYYIGCAQSLPSTCGHTLRFQCGPGNSGNGESGVSVQTSPDLRNWTPRGMVLNSTSMHFWNTDLTNPSPLPISSKDNSALDTLLVAYRGLNYDGHGMEQIGITRAADANYAGPYDVSGDPVIPGYSNEDPFLWQDPRGNFHMLMHSTDGRLGGGPGQSSVGRHAFAECWNCTWTYNTNTIAYNTTVQFKDGSTTIYSRRERPQLFFTPSGDPAYLLNGVQELNVKSSHTLITPIGPQT